MVTDGSSLPTLRRRLALAGLPAATGAGLVVHILAGSSLLAAIAAVAAAGVGGWGFLLSRLDGATRATLRRRVRIGAVAGLCGTVAYDLARYGSVALFSLSFQPFHVFSVFGEALLGSDHSPALLLVAGTLYHVANGTFFGVTYTLILRRPSVFTGVLWGIALELCMASLYPAWLRIQMFREFLEVTAVGHVVYGAVLGAIAARGVQRMRANGSELEAAA